MRIHMPCPPRPELDDDGSFVVGAGGGLADADVVVDDAGASVAGAHVVRGVIVAMFVPGDSVDGPLPPVAPTELATVCAGCGVPTFTAGCKREWRGVDARAGGAATGRCCSAAAAGDAAVGAAVTGPTLPTALSGVDDEPCSPGSIATSAAPAPTSATQPAAGSFVLSRGAPRSHRGRVCSLRRIAAPPPAIAKPEPAE
jgi:hypothetical protein